MGAGVVRHAGELLVGGGHGLAHGEAVGLPHVLLGEGEAGELPHLVLLTGLERAAVHEASVRVGKKRLGVFVVALDLEGELTGHHLATVQHLGNVDAGVFRVRGPVRVEEARALDAVDGLIGVSGGLDDERAVLVLDLDGRRAGVAVVGHATGRLGGRDLTDLEDVLARKREGRVSEVEGHSPTVLRAGDLGGCREPGDTALGAADLLGLEGELLALERVAAGQGLRAA